MFRDKEDFVNSLVKKEVFGLPQEKCDLGSKKWATSLVLNNQHCYQHHKAINFMRRKTSTKSPNDKEE